MNQRWPALSKYKYSEVFPPQHVFKYADLIRKNIGTDSIDLLQFHVWSDHWADEADFRNTVQKLKRDGVIRSFGLSLNRWEPENGIKATRTGLVDSEQVIYSIFDQSPEDELVPACQELNVGVIVRVTLDEGSLGGKMSKDTKVPASGWRSRYFNPKNLANTMERVDKLKQILPPGMSLSQMALRLRRMGLEYVDIIYSHGVDAETPLEETMGALAAMHRRGKAPYVGISSYSPALTAQAAEILKSYGMPLLIHQPSYFHAQPLD